MSFLEIIFLLLLSENFDVAKNIRDFLENLFEYYFFDIIVNVDFFSDLEFEYYSKYNPEILLQVNLK